MKILVIFTGGTIGSSVSDGWIAPDAGTKYLLLQNYTAHGDKSVQFESVEPYTILSENLSAAQINALIRCVGGHLDGGYDGIIVTHGTDTLQYSAAALSYAFGDRCIPIALVSSNYPLSDPRANGNRNFEAAVEFIKARAGKGVFVCYANSADCVQIHCANMLLAHNEMRDAVFSIYENNYACYRGGTIVLTPDFKAPEYREPLGEFELVRESDILAVSSFPGDRFDYPLEGRRAVILRPYHSGTLNTDNPHLKDFCLRAKAAGIPVFIVNVGAGAAYESAKIYGELGITILPMSAFPSIYMKAWIAVSCGRDVAEFVRTPLAGEFCE